MNTLSLDALFRELTRDGSLHRLLLLARDEDLGPGGAPGDITSLVSVDENEVIRAHVVARTAGVLAGVRTLAEVLRIFAPRSRVEVNIEDGSPLARGSVAALIEGPAREVLAAERTLLNLVGRLSGVATRTRRFVDAVAGLPVQLLDTRKTTPGLRTLEKYAVRCGGGFCHRLGLFDAILIKDNHLAGIPVENLSEVVRRALTASKALGAGIRFFEVEVDSLAQFEALLAAGVCGPGGVDVILLDNMPPAKLREAVSLRARHGGNLILEASGGVTLDTVRAIAETGIDRISVGGLTHQAVSLDLALDAARQ